MNQRGHEIERGVDKNRHFQRGANILCSQDEKRVTGIAKTEHCSREQIFPIGRRKLSQANVDLRLQQWRQASPSTARPEKKRTGQE